jgi:hypothetical protein
MHDREDDEILRLDVLWLVFVGNTESATSYILTMNSVHIAPSIVSVGPVQHQHFIF